MIFPRLNKKRSIFAALILVLVFSGCQERHSRSERQDQSKRADAVPANIERIISTAPSNTEIIAALGFGDRIAAMDKYSLGVEGAAAEALLIDFAYPDGEVILSLEPDIVFASGHNETVSGSDPFRLIREAGIPVISIPTSVSIDGICREILLIAGALGVPEKGEALAADMMAEIGETKRLCQTAAEKRTVYFEISPFPYMVTLGSETYLDEMISAAGGVNIFAGERSWFSPSPEAIIERDPDVILTLTGSGASQAAPLLEMRSRSGFEGIKAVRNSRVYAIDADAASRPSHRIVFALKQMARAIYPELF